MAAGQPLRGLAGQNLAGRRPKPFSCMRAYPPGSYTFQAPVSGTFEFAGWGPGNNQGGAVTAVSGAFALRRFRLTKSQSVAINVGAGTATSGPSGGFGTNTPTNITFPDGSQVIWTDPNPGSGVPGAAIGGDVNIAGNTSASVAAAAPSYQNYTGGGAAPNGNGNAESPGGGAFFAASIRGTSGLIIVTLVGPAMRVV